MSDDDKSEAQSRVQDQTIDQDFRDKTSRESKQLIKDLIYKMHSINNPFLEYDEVFQLSNKDIKEMIKQCDDQIKNIDMIQNDFKDKDKSYKSKSQVLKASLAENSEIMKGLEIANEAMREHDESLKWEPHTVIEKIQTLFVNSFEIFYVLLICERSLHYKNFLGLGFMMLSVPLITTMTSDPKVRYTRGLYVIGICFLFFVALAILKLRLLKKLVISTTDYSQYTKQRNFYQFAGFSFAHEISEEGPQGTVYECELRPVDSWSVECWVVPLMFLASWFFNRQRKKIKFLLQNTEEPQEVELRPKILDLEGNITCMEGNCQGIYKRSPDEYVNSQPIWDKVSTLYEEKYCAVLYKDIWHIVQANETRRDEIIKTKGECITNLNLDAIRAKVSAQSFSQCRWKDGISLQYFEKHQTNQLEINEYRDIWSFFHDKDENEDKKKEISLGTQSKSREEEEYEEKLKQSKKQRLKDIEAKISKNFVDSIWYFDQDQKFTMLTIFFQVTGATAFNSCSDLPALLLILILAALWPFRKKNSLFFRKYTMFLYYFIIVSLFLQIIGTMAENVDYINDNYINVDGSRLQKLFQLWFNVQTVQMYNYLTCMFFAISIKNCKWIEIREVTKDLKNKSFITRYFAYFKIREQKDKLDLINKSITARSNRGGIAGAIKKIKDKKDENKSKKRMSLSQRLETKSEQRFVESFLPAVILQSSRLLLLFTSYFYHSQASLINVVWVVLSLVFDERLVFILSTVIMQPILILEFVLIYGGKIPVVKDQKFFLEYGSWFKWDMYNNMFEQTLMFLILICFSMMFACISITESQENSDIRSNMLRFFIKRCSEQKYSKNWKMVFLATRYAQSILLFFLLVRAITNLNNMLNLGYMIFFAIYTAYESIYRKTSMILVLFVGQKLIMEYYFSLYWKLDQDNLRYLKRLQWLNYIPQDCSFEDPFEQDREKPDWMKAFAEKDPMYFNVMPSAQSWIVLIFMSFLQDINLMYKDTENVAKLKDMITYYQKKDFPKIMYYSNRFWKIFSGVLINTILCFLVYLVIYIETNFINWVFYVLTTLLIAFKLRSSSSLYALKQSLTVVNILKLYSLVILIIIVLFVSFVGQEDDEQNKIQKFIRENLPIISNNYMILGLRRNINDIPQNYKMDEEIEKRWRWTLLTYMSYFMLSIYVSNYSKAQYDIAKSELEFEEENYKNMFMFKTRKESHSQQQGEAKRFSEFIADAGHSVYKKKEKGGKSYYTADDLNDFYENVRFTVPFIVYRRMKLWPLLDFFANYCGHLINNLFIVIIAINFNVSAIMCFEIFCVCYLYMMATWKLNKKSLELYRSCGLQSQCDLGMARIISKKFQHNSSQIFLKLRIQVSRIQFIVFILMIWISFPTSIIFDYRSRDPANRILSIDQIDNISFWLFFFGVYKDGRTNVNGMDYSYFNNITFIGLGIGIVIEKLSISWLNNRMGCTHYRLQKFIELDVRHQAILNDWPEKRPAYNVKSYEEHYFLNDIKSLQKKFTDKKYGNVDEEGNALTGDFVPYKIGVRIKEVITFTLKMACRSPDLNIDDNVKQQLLDKDKELVDYESIKILKNYKAKQLEHILQNAVDLKYKISLAKGIQLFLEIFMIFLLMLSLVLKSNLLSLFYFVFVLRSVTTNLKTSLLVRVNLYMAIIFALQYFFYLMNLTSSSSPAPFPIGFDAYPLNEQNPSDLTIKYPIPWFFHYPMFRENLNICYLIGIGVDKDQLENLIIDFVNLFMITIYIFAYRNPILRKSMRKVFWQFPTSDNIEQWNRLDPVVQKQVQWLHNPIPLMDKDQENKERDYNKEQSNYKDTTLERQNQVEDARKQYEFAVEYNLQNRKDLNYTLTNYVDIKFQDIWADEYLKEKKGEIKRNSAYYRIVKQGSQLVYLTFHIFTIFLVLLMATLRQSLIAIGYVIILLPRIKDGAEVLNQRSKSQAMRIQKMKDRLEEIQKQMDEMEQDGDDKDKEQYWELENKYNELDYQIKKQKETKFTTRKQREHEKKMSDQKEWPMIPLIQKYLMIYGLIDISMQIVFQLPYFANFSSEKIEEFKSFGFRKIWYSDRVFEEGNHEVLSYHEFLHAKWGEHVGLKFSERAFIIQSLNIVIIAIIQLQSAIFSSFGYQKYVTQTDGSMDLLMQLSELKGKSITYIFNNYKIRKIVSNTRKKETIMKSVERLKQKLNRWRAFTRTTLDTTAVTADAVNQAESERIINEKKDAEKQKKGGTQKKVKFDGETKEQKDDDVEEVIQKSTARFSDEERAMIIKTLSKEFVESKQKKLRYCVSFYIWLNTTFTQQLIFKNNRNDLKELNQKYAEGEVKIPCELESIMEKESYEIIKKHFDNRDGNKILHNLLMKSRNKKDIKLMEMTGIDKKIKLNQMSITWNFTRSWAMAIRIIETIFYIWVSQTQNLIYFSMILSMYMNAGLISIFYPIMVFGFGLIEEVRPKKEFWRIIRLYTTFVLIIKMIFNLSYFTVQFKFFETDAYKRDIQGFFKIGLQKKDTIYGSLIYMAPEMLIISYIMLNEIKLKLCGLYFQTEEELESIQEAIQRNMEKGDEERLKQKKAETANMCMAKHFESIQMQLKFKENLNEFWRGEIKKDIETRQEEKASKEQIEQEFKKQESEKSVKEQQEEKFREISKQIFKTSKQFDVDASAQNSHYDELVQENVLQKSLESDDLIYVEGMRLEYQVDFLTKEQVEHDLIDPDNWESFSSPDFDEQYQKVIEAKDKRTQPKLGFFEKSRYMNQIFPSLKIQKPGYDLYGTTTSISAFICVFVFVQFKDITFDASKFVKGSSDIWTAGRALTVVILIFVMILERIVNRTDTKQVENKGTIETKADEKQGYLSQEEIFKKTSTARSMTVALKTMKTGDIDMQGGAAQALLQDMYQLDDGGIGMDNSRIKVTPQQKGKFILHWLMLICGHLYIFWAVPIYGNFMLYDQPHCNEELKHIYGCKNFTNNSNLRTLYILMCIYYTLSALQLSYGFPTLRKPSSVLQTYTDEAKLASDIYALIPFAVELRCLIDFTWHKTSLDMFQTMQLYMYHYEIYASMIGNMWYIPKILGKPVDPSEKCIFGFLATGLVTFLLVGPFLLFSDLIPGLVVFNPVKNANIQLFFTLNQTIYSNATDQHVFQTDSLLDSLDHNYTLLNEMIHHGDIVVTNMTVPNIIYENKHPFFQTFSQERWLESEYYNWTETASFAPEQIQIVEANEVSDGFWHISEPSLDIFRSNINEAINVNQTYIPGENLPQDKNISLSLQVDFQRPLPADAQTPSKVFTKALNYSHRPDCLTGLQLRFFADSSRICHETQGAQTFAMTFSQVYIPNIIFGQTNKANIVNREELEYEDQLHDVGIVYKCDKTWELHSKVNATRYTEEQMKQMEVVDIETCQAINDPQSATTPEIEGKKSRQYDDANPEWSKLQFTLFSFTISTSFLAAYSFITFFTGVVYLLGGYVRPVFMINTWMSMLYELTSPQVIIKLIEAIYIHRHEQNLRSEEEAYRMLVEICRSPELFKALTGSSLKGDCDPKLDKLSQEEQARYKHLERLEQGGFDVDALKKRLLADKEEAA